MSCGLSCCKKRDKENGKWDCTLYIGPFFPTRILRAFYNIVCALVEQAVLVVIKVFTLLHQVLNLTICRKQKSIGSLCASESELMRGLILKASKNKQEHMLKNGVCESKQEELCKCQNGEDMACIFKCQGLFKISIYSSCVGALRTEVFVQDTLM